MNSDIAEKRVQPPLEPYIVESRDESSWFANRVGRADILTRLSEQSGKHRTYSMLLAHSETDWADALQLRTTIEQPIAQLDKWRGLSDWKLAATPLRTVTIGDPDYCFTHDLLNGILSKAKFFTQNFYAHSIPADTIALNDSRSDDIKKSIIAASTWKDRIEALRAITRAWEALEKSQRVAESQARKLIRSSDAPKLAASPQWLDEAIAQLKATTPKGVSVQTAVIDSAKQIIRSCLAAVPDLEDQPSLELGPLGVVAIEWNIAGSKMHWTVGVPRIHWPGINVHAVSLKKVDGQPKGESRFFYTANDLVEHFKGACRGGRGS